MTPFGTRIRRHIAAVGLAVMLPLSGASASLIDPGAFGLQRSGIPSVVIQSGLSDLYAKQVGPKADLFTQNALGLRFRMDVTNEIIEEIRFFSFDDPRTTYYFEHTAALAITDSNIETTAVEIISQGSFDDIAGGVSYAHALIRIDFTGFTGFLFDTLSALPALEKIEALASLTGGATAGPIATSFTFTALEPAAPPPPLPLPSEVPVPPGIALALPVLLTGILAARRRSHREG